MSYEQISCLILLNNLQINISITDKEDATVLIIVLSIAVFGATVIIGTIVFIIKRRQKQKNCEQHPEEHTRTVPSAPHEDSVRTSVSNVSEIYDEIEDSTYDILTLDYEDVNVYDKLKARNSLNSVSTNDPKTNEDVI